MKKSPITTHILDLHFGKPAADVSVSLFAPDMQEAIAKATTDLDGRILDWPAMFELQPGVWSLEFYIQPWFEQQKRDAFFADIRLNFKVEDLNAHYHVPLLLNEFGYSTYRGS